MPLVTDSVWTDLLLAAGVLGLVLYKYVKHRLEFWDRRGIVNTKKIIFLDIVFGRRSMAQVIEDIYQQFKTEKYCGCFFTNQPMLVVRDSDLIHNILVKDFVHFYDRGGIRLLANDPLRDNLFNLKGRVWRELRYKLTPTFSTGKLKGMFEQVSKCGNSMIYKIEKLSEISSDIESKEFLFEFTADVISSCAFGVQFDPASVEFKTFKNAVTKLFNPSVTQFARVLFVLTLPKLAELLRMNPNFDGASVKYFLTLIKTASKYRKDNQVERNDYLQLLLKLQEQDQLGQGGLKTSASDFSEDDVIIDQMEYAGKAELPLDNNEIFMTDERVCANSVIFLVAGSESTSSTINLILFELARHPEVQQRLQTEVDRVLATHGGQWSYQAVKDMVYLDQVVQEVQRLYPVIPFLIREVTQRYRLPDSDRVLEKGTVIGVPVSGLHLDPEIHHEPLAFRPERFEGNNFKPGPGFLPFGDGPRICIAMRFAVMEVKTAVARIAAQYSVQLSPKTTLPLQFEPRAFIPQVKGGIWLRFEKRDKNTI